MTKKHLALIILAVLIALLICGPLLWFAPGPSGDKIKQLFASQETIRAFVQSFGLWAPAIFFLLQVAQVIFSPLPGSVTILAGGLIFGVGLGFLLSGAAVLVGSLIAFFLTRLMGQRMVIHLIGQRQYERYNRFFASKWGLSLVILFLLPFFPDDVLCFLAGLSSLSVGIFVLFLLVGRLPGIFLTTLIGAGAFSFSWWEWIAIGVLSLGVVIVYVKYGDRFERWLQRKGKE